MVVRAERVVDVPASRERVWEFISDPETRARSISVVTDFELVEEGRAIWHVALPIPLLDQTIEVETEERSRTPPEHVEFVGTSKAFRVVGEHELTSTGDQTRLRNTFTVDGRLPGVEHFFKTNIDAELENFESAILREIESDVDGN